LDLDDDFPCDFGECDGSCDEEFIPEIDKLIPVMEQLTNPQVCTNPELSDLCKSLGLPSCGTKLKLLLFQR
jgi:hypothetical protein